MRVLRYVFSIILSLSGFLGCKDIPRDNVLDPKNPLSLRKQPVLIEAFVNTNHILTDSVMYNQNMLTALSLLQNKYSPQIIVAIHHRNLSLYRDSLAIFESEDLYVRYLQALNEAVKGVPDVFINGLGARIQGATSSDNAAYRIETALQAFLIKNSFFTIEPEVVFTDGTLRCTVTLARLGASVAEDLLVKMLVLQDIDYQWQHQAVRTIKRSNLIPELLPGERRTIEFGTVSGLREISTRVVITVVSDDEYIVYQSTEVRL